MALCLNLVLSILYFCNIIQIMLRGSRVETSRKQRALRLKFGLLKPYSFSVVIIGGLWVKTDGI